jgi:hypothetical protein
MTEPTDEELLRAWRYTPDATIMMMIDLEDQLPDTSDEVKAARRRVAKLRGIDLAALKQSGLKA